MRDIRSSLSRDWLMTRDTISGDDLLELKWQTRVQLADLVLDDLIVASAAHEDLTQVVQVLRTWDRHCSSTSRGYALFHLWAHEHLPRSDVYMDGSHLTPPVQAGQLPTGLVDVESAVSSLRRAVATLASHGFDCDVSYGEFGAIGAGGAERPASGGPSFFGVFKCLELVPTPGRWHGIGGDTWIALTRFNAHGPEASALLVNGNVTEATGPPHESQFGAFHAARLLATAQLKTSDNRRSTT